MLKCLQVVAPLLNKGMVVDCMVGVADTEKFLAYYPSKMLNLNIKPGDLLKPGSINYEAVHEKRWVLRTVSREVYGIPYIASGYPIMENGQVVGCLATGISTDREDRLEMMAIELSKVLGEISVSAESVAIDAVELASLNQNNDYSSMQVLTKIEQSSEISTFINSVSMKTKILGLNASIEAARSGASGKGFMVIAEEIRNLSGTVSQSSNHIHQELFEMKEITANMSTELRKSMDFSLKQSAEIQQLLSSIQQLRQMSEELRGLSKMLLEQI